MGRPREFETEDALHKAMHQFWSKGYYDTSIRDLIGSTGVNYYGLYGTFQNKRGLMLAALDHYRKTITAEFTTVLDASEPTRDGLRGALLALADLLRTEAGQAGCMMCNAATELAPHDADVAARVRAHMAHLTDRFAEWLRRADHAGTIVGGEPTARAEFLATTAYAIGLLLRAGFDRDAVTRHVEVAVSAVQ